MAAITKTQADELLAACVDGDDDAWRELFRLLYPLAHWIASGPKFRMPDDLARDIAQETMIDLATAIRREKVRNLSGYVRAVAHNKCVDRIRGNSPLDNLAHPEAQKKALHSAPVPEEMPLHRAESDVIEALRMCLADIGEPCHELLTQRYLHEKSYKEVASYMSIPVAQIGVRVGRCLKRLQDALAERRPRLQQELRELLSER